MTSALEFRILCTSGFCIFIGKAFLPLVLLCILLYLLFYDVFLNVKNILLRKPGFSRVNFLNSSGGQLMGQQN